MALGGSTNTCLHIPAIAHDAGIELDARRLRPDQPHDAPHLEASSRRATTSWKTSTSPAACRRCSSGSRSSINDSPERLAASRSHEIADAAEITDDDVIRPLDNAVRQAGRHRGPSRQPRPGRLRHQAERGRPHGDALRGQGHVLRQRRRRHEGDHWPARSSPATSSSSATKAPRGGPGMREMLSPTAAIVGMGLGDQGRPPHGRAFLRRHQGPLHRAHFARSGGGRADRRSSRTATPSLSISLTASWKSR